MIPRSFSASAFNVADLCPARYKAEYLDRGDKIAHPAASLGTAVHGALEIYVKRVYLEKAEPASINLLLDLFKISYMTTFSTADLDTEAFADGCAMLHRWFARTDFNGFEVLSCEVKESFPLNTSLGPIPYNYIWDRSDYLGNDEYRIVDYKTQRWAWNATELRKKIQVRGYGLAAQIKWPDAKRIWVELDFLRHENPIGVAISRDENIAAWAFFKARANQIIATPDNEAPEILNPECRFCIRKQACSALQKNISVGGILSLGSAKDMIDARAQLEYQRQGITAALEEIDTFIIAESKETDVLEWESEFNEMSITAKPRRAIDGERVEHVLGPELWNKYGKQSITLEIIDKLLRGGELSIEQKSQLKGLIYKKPGEAKISIKPKNPFGEYDG